ncbi:helix-turn-helix domain-containing protein [Methylobacterium sp. 88A]|uniref:helix-turn-helix domain-containing protein n=1 Tax=Methylobacterium sp. 88A TaxID=1131813 RepID=UPI00036AEA0B|nr:helix-turn-helix domain-containing protein [Methylobacterium sp. 88A]
MNERAAPALGPLWHVEGGHTFFAGPLAYNASHQHGAPVYLAGLYGPFRIRFRPGPWIACRTAFVPAGMRHELDCAGDPLAVLYLEPEAGARALLGLIAAGQDIDGARVAMRGEIEPLRALYECPRATVWAGQAIADLAGFAVRRNGPTLDGRIARIMADLGTCQDTGMSAPRLAASVGLSSSRMQHLFTREVGVPFRRYRSWLRMRRAIDAVIRGETFTGAAHDAAFADQAHFANAFRETFGAPASASLVGIRRP